MQLWKPLLALSLLLPVISHAETFHLGSIAAEYLSEVKKFKPLTDYLTTHLSDHGYDRAEVVVSHSISDMAAKMAAGEVDLFIDSPYPALMVSEQSNSKMVLRRWKKGVANYHSVIVTKRESPISTLQDLRGQRVAFEEPFSTASFFLAKSDLIQSGLEPVEEPGSPEQLTAESLLYRFSGDDKTTISWVLRNRVDAGAIGNHKFNQLKERIRNRLKVIHHSIEVPRHIVSFRADLPAETITRVSQIMTTMDRDKIGQEVLKKFQKTKKFDLIPDKSLRNLNQLKRLIHNRTPQ